MDYSKTLHLPETEFPMRGNLPKKEPGFVEFWQQNHLYEKESKRERKKAHRPSYCTMARLMRMARSTSAMR